MATTLKALIPGSVLTTSPVVYYTAPANTYAVIKQLAFANLSASAVTVDLYLVNDTSSPTDADQLIKSEALAVNETWVAYQANGQVLEPGYTIQASCSAGSAVTIKCSGIESV